MTSAHAIGRLDFETRFGGEDLAFDAQPRLEALFKTRAMHVIEQVFDHASEPGIVWQVDRLEIDLGTIPARAFEAVFEQRLREQLTQALHLGVNRSPDDGKPAGRAVSATQADLLAFIHFLESHRGAVHIPIFRGDQNESAFGLGFGGIGDQIHQGFFEMDLRPPDVEQVGSEPDRDARHDR